MVPFASGNPDIWESPIFRKHPIFGNPDFTRFLEIPIFPDFWESQDFLVGIPENILIRFVFTNLKLYCSSSDGAEHDRSEKISA